METKQSLDDRFTDALRAHRPAMYRVAYTMLHSQQDAEDAVASATLCAYRAASRIRSWEAVKPYLLRVTVNACHAILRRRRREIPSDVSTLLAARPAAEETPVWMYLQQLPLPLRTVMQLRFGEGMRLKDVAGALRLPKGTVSSRISRAQRLLREWMEREGY